MADCALIAPSFYCGEKDFLNVQKNIQKIGFDSILNFTSQKKLFKWAGDSNERLRLFYDAWNSDSETVLCCLGGSGISHFLSKINKSKLKKKKLFVGYSDITLLLNFLSKKLDIITLHGPNGLKNLDEKSMSALRDALQMKNYGIKFNSDQILKPFNIKEFNGKILGGNLERLVASLFYYDLDFRNKIVFLEDINCSEYKIFNFLFFLKNYPKFKPKVILFGDLNIKDKPLMRKMIRYLFPETPIIMDLPIGHCTPNITIPIGVDCNVDFLKNTIDFMFLKKHKKYAVKFD